MRGWGGGGEGGEKDGDDPRTGVGVWFVRGRSKSWGASCVAVSTQLVRGSFFWGVGVNMMNTSSLEGPGLLDCD